MTKIIHEVRSVKFSEDKRGIDYANDIQEDTNCDNLTYKVNCEEIVAEDFLILKEDNPVTESKMKSQEDTSVKLGGNCENDSSQTEPIQERCVKGGRKKGETKSILEERHKARLEEQERKLIEEGVRRSQRIKDRNDANLIMEIDHYVPENFKEAMDSGERNEWHKAMEDELSEIEKHKVWTLVPRENGMKVINSKWVYSTKKTPSDGIYKRKARLVAVGCNQRYGVDYKESFSPVLKKESLRTIVALATQQYLTIKTYDVKTAYLYEKKDSEPFIGIEIKREEDGFYLYQAHYIDTILHRFGLEECNSVQTPGDQNQNLDEYLDSKPIDKTVYQEMIGSLMYLSTGTRPDISFNVSNLSQYIESRDVKFIENKKGVSLLKSDQNEVQDYCIFKFPEENFDYDSENKPSEESNIQELEEATQQQQNNVVPYLRPSARNKYYCELSSDEEELSDDSRLDPTFDPTEHNLFALDEIPIPNSYEEAINSKNPEYWIEAMQREMNSLQEHQVWDHVYLPKGVKPIKSKWVYSSKVDPSTGQTIFKARLVALGCCQKDGTYFQNICSPVMKSDSFRTLLAYCVLQGWSLIHCDVQTAFLYGKLDEDIYLLPPQGYQPTDENLV
ncbi:hypothetical protein LAZ67_12001953 [Cordylochernes scorpioides]|uniref:Reverse transcriptase Ty1/copia-type domain-containing protein n=1 Tax=Cordylochernes scorpioides TaxID=51811 RepID=A0ABY6L3D7_9ARAC|nr:hypothetical protein LAZ67_12001953 [Cordylochernes scorpioides]